MKRRFHVKKLLWRAALYATLILLAFICLLPLLWMFRSSFMSIGQIFQNRPVVILPDPFIVTNYVKALTMVPFAKYFKNTLLLVVLNLSGTIVTSSLAAYGFSRIKWRGREAAFALILSGMMLPYSVTLVPTFTMWRGMGLIDSFYPLFIPAFLGGGAFNIFLLRQFFNGLPMDLDESAYLDGATRLVVFLRIILPLSTPPLIVVGMFNFFATWNDFLAPLIYLNSENRYTVALGLRQFTSGYAARWDLLMAAATVAIAPPLILFLIGQKYFIEGIALTGLKG
jgi:multiple sugar transport system permease protein